MALNVFQRAAAFVRFRVFSEVDLQEEIDVDFHVRNAHRQQELAEVAKLCRIVEDFAKLGGVDRRVFRAVAVAKVAFVKFELQRSRYCPELLYWADFYSWRRENGPAFFKNGT